MSLNLTQKAVLITGGSGYFGEVLAKRVMEVGGEVRIFDKNAPQNSKFKFFPGDIRDQKAVELACDGIDVVLHNVAQVPLAKDLELFHSVNIVGTKILLNAALKQHVQKVVYTSSSAVFGVPENNPVSEETTPTPMEAYGRAKLDGEKLCEYFSSLGLDVSIVRPRTILGHGRLGIFQILFEWVRTGKNIPVLGDGENIYQFIHADDLAEIILRVASRQGSETFNAGASRFCTMRHTLESLVAHAGTTSKVRSLPSKPVEVTMNIASSVGASPLGKYHSLMYGKSLYFNNDKVKNILNYETVHDNISAICDSYDWYKQHYQDLKSTDGVSPHKKAVKQGILKLVNYFL